MIPILNALILLTGIIAITKVQYKKMMVTKLVEAYSGDVDKMIQDARKAKQGRKGFRYGCEATVLDAAELIEKCWAGLAPTAISNCWRHSTCLPNKIISELSSTTLDDDPRKSFSDFQMVLS